MFFNFLIISQFGDKTRSLPMIFFMTDGQANVGVTGTQNIIREVKKINHFGIPIYGLAYGQDAGIN